MKKKLLIIFGVLAITLLGFAGYLRWYNLYYEPTDIIKYSDDKLITMDDFRAEPDENSTSYSLGQYRILFRHNCTDRKCLVYAYMEPYTSWMYDKTRQESLISQRITFKCYELFARKLRKTLSETDNLCDRSVEEREQMGGENYADLEEFLSVMYTDCKGSDEKIKIEKWRIKVDSLLNQYSQYREETIFIK